MTLIACASRHKFYNNLWCGCPWTGVKWCLRLLMALFVMIAFSFQTKQIPVWVSSSRRVRKSGWPSSGEFSIIAVVWWAWDKIKHLLGRFFIRRLEITENIQRLATMESGAFLLMFNCSIKTLTISSWNTGYESKRDPDDNAPRCLSMFRAFIHDPRRRLHVVMFPHDAE